MGRSAHFSLFGGAARELGRAQKSARRVKSEKCLERAEKAYENAC